MDINKEQGQMKDEEPPNDEERPNDNDEVLDETQKESIAEDPEIEKARISMKRKEVHKMLRHELKVEMSNIIVGCVCLLGSTASNACT